MIRSLRNSARAIALLYFCLALALLASAGCGTKATGPDEPTTKVPPVEDESKDVSAKGKKWEGWRWQGARDSCQYVFKNECFASEEAACKAADCGDAACRTKEGAPNVVSCGK